jgi:hypothetical protein
MVTKQHEIEALVEDLIENTILEAFQDYFTNKHECELALEVLKVKLEELETDVFDELFY